MSPPSSAAACIPAASAAADFSTHQAISPTLAMAPTRSVARRIASAGSSQPIVMPHLNVDGMPETFSGLNTSMGPSRARYPAVAV